MEKSRNPNSLESTRFLTVKDAAKILGVRPGFIYERIADESLKAIRLSARRYAISETDLSHFLNERRTGD